MLVENESNLIRIKREPGPILGVMFIVLLLAAICAVSVMVMNELKQPRPTVQQDIPVLTSLVVLPDGIQANHYSTLLPVILSGSVSVSGQIWKVTKINSLGYELDSQRYDLATFTSIDGQDIAQGYCINRGWDIPNIGIEYLLNAEGIFIPLTQSDAHPIQRFLRIQK
jgi:hypothetical protein